MVEDTDAYLEAPTRGKDESAAGSFSVSGQAPSRLKPVLLTDRVHSVGQALAGMALEIPIRGSKTQNSLSSSTHLPNPKHHNYRPAHPINRLLLAGIRPGNPRP